MLKDRPIESPERNCCIFIRFGDIHGPKPYKCIGFGDIHGPKPYKFIGFGDIHGPKPYKFIGFGDIHGPKPITYIRITYPARDGGGRGRSGPACGAVGGRGEGWGRGWEGWVCGGGKGAALLAGLLVGG